MSGGARLRFGLGLQLCCGGAGGGSKSRRSGGLRLLVPTRIGSKRSEGGVTADAESRQMKTLHRLQGYACLLRNLCIIDRIEGVGGGRGCLQLCCGGPGWSRSRMSGGARLRLGLGLQLCCGGAGGGSKSRMIGGLMN
jgi:hypothetical protein